MEYHSKQCDLCHTSLGQSAVSGFPPVVSVIGGTSPARVLKYAVFVRNSTSDLAVTVSEVWNTILVISICEEVA